MRFLVTGAGGQLGKDLLALLGASQAVGLTHNDLDIADATAVDQAMATHRPDVVVNTAAWTDVDGAESNEAAAMAVNCDGPAYIAATCARRNCALVHVSTDYVFDGTATEPYAEDAPIAPRSAYGRSKAAGERAVLDAGGPVYVVRTAWLYGAGGRNFVRTMAGLARGGGPVNVVNDQRGAPTWTRDLAGGLLALVDERPAPGIYHATSSGDTTWFAFAQAIFSEVGADPARVHPVPSSAYPRPAPRPAYSVLSANRWVSAGLTPLPHWRQALATAVASEGAALVG
ncbi:MAG: dTDP-4-dehydrorhamnose reductase [Actinomycetes bacterium]